MCQVIQNRDRKHLRLSRVQRYQVFFETPMGREHLSKVLSKLVRKNEEEATAPKVVTVFLAVRRAATKKHRFLSFSKQNQNSVLTSYQGI